MPHLSSSFSSLTAGKLTVILTGVWYYGTRRDAGFSSSNGAPNYLIRAYVGPSGARQYLQPIDRYVPVVTAVFDYPGGGVVWDYGTETVAWTLGGSTGIVSFGFQDLRVQLSLQPAVG